ncbi:NPC intracellular cholesterol transporter 2 homolog a-like [Pollicipes pollicipes]|uniref:NPC intracellular cholesterol transporter 2 homolog a-like n=1 Tax=Pollicipes pollicipes TaxID=41117 RepID=UPI001885A1B7|nr:NPC intracellular cholesterol transporter 2 homolog a-like [Pollicipes pollicipes]XP_037084422.1 NPC intracellular cholesterol transporter 2 homolog a-like [Pollicipes pollicipes]XP_037093469.1 NPC intracellular cholesterol transporter 2 homolog a-like [Pollicipes pollicipes]
MIGLQTVLLVGGLVAAAVATPYQDCGTRSVLTSLEIVGCDEVPCILKRGGKVTLNADILSDTHTDGLVSEIAGIIAGVPVPFLKDDKACDGLTSGSCPLEVADKASFSASVDVLKEYPPIAVTLQWKLKDDAGSEMCCVEIPAKIQ